MRRWIAPFLLSFTFLTRLPLSRFFKFDYTGEDFRSSILFFPVIGAFSGFLNIVLYKLFSIVFPGVIALLGTLFFQYLFFNLFHFDGFLDFFEAILSGKREEESLLKIMKEPHIGVFGLFIGIFYVLFKFFLLNTIISWKIQILYLYPIIGRSSQVLLMALSKPARDEGLASLFCKLSWKLVLLSYILGGVFFLFGERNLFLYILIPPFSAFVLSFVSFRKLGGFTGDVVGATNEVSELLFLFCFQILYYMV